MRNDKINTNEIIRMMKEAGFYIGKDDEFEPAWERFYQLAFAAGAAHEREACANVCEENGKEPDDHKTYEGYDEGYQDGSNNCAAAIRARGE